MANRDIEGEESKGDESAGSETIGKGSPLKGDEVAGREIETITVTCPYCGTIRTVMLNPHVYQRYICSNCNNGQSGVA